jgi:hypothetical protein
MISKDSAFFHGFFFADIFSLLDMVLSANPDGRISGFEGI